MAFGQTGYDFTPLIEQFQAETGIKITTAPQENYDLKAELIKRSGKKRLPDAFIAPADYTTIQSINLIPLDDDWLVPEISAESLQTVSQNGNIVAVPIISGNHLVMYYNRSALEAPAKTMSELLQQRQTLPDNMRLISWSFNGMYFLIPFLSSFDALPIQGERLRMGTPMMAKAIEYYWRLPERGLAQPTCSHDCYPQQFKEGKFAYVIDGVWNFQQYQQALRDDLGIALLPAINGQPMRPYFSAHVLAIIAKQYSKAQLQALQQFARFLQSVDAQKFMWDSARAIPSNNEALKGIVASSDDNTRMLIRQLQNANPIPNSPHMSVVWEAMSKGFNRYGAQLMSAEESAQLMQHLAERTIAHQR
ncbi:maltose ABC transporter substrate-binding protein MalE [Planctobacterium marinum]|uniref:Maltose ABC transporter substrate-binding protein MalE n=1 Tax=Planctobacterium marinum TaxID=1631968 RepID=A0AA48I7G7_9ALTE|nr:maltose ABC transporter substrate-binding protein MalE [Planctobacterium marinum]